MAPVSRARSKPHIARSGERGAPILRQASPAVHGWNPPPPADDMIAAQ
jgi:hypothetical protein